MAANTINNVLRNLTLSYLSEIRRQPSLPDAKTIEFELLQNITDAFKTHNKMQDDGSTKWKIPQTLHFSQIADIMAQLHPICTINTSGQNKNTEYNILAVYQDEGPNKGIYVTDEDTFRQIAEQYNYQLTTHEFNECMSRLRTLVPKRELTRKRNLIAVNNGIFDYDTKELLPFSSDYVFTSKSRVNYNPLAKNVTLHNPDDVTDWDVESWMNTLSDDPEVVDLLWQILGAIVRPNVAWNKSAWFYSESGNNGKGTLCELMRQLCGEGTYTSIPLSHMSSDFMLEPLIHASAIIVDENDVGTFIDKAANLKAIITNDVIQINRKYKQPIAYRFYGFMVQCLNEMPRIRDKSDSFFRRQLFIPFTKCFTGKERKYIKHDYLHRQEVLEYVLYRVLNMNYYTLATPKSCEDALDEYKSFNDPIRGFAEEILPQCNWDFLPYKFLYDMYLSWFKKNSPSGTALSEPSFRNDLKRAISNEPNWLAFDQQKRVGTQMDSMEPLLDEYGLVDWMNPNFVTSDKRIKNTDLAKQKDRCTPTPDQFRGRRFRGGLIRTTTAVTTEETAEEETT